MKSKRILPHMRKEEPVKEDTEERQCAYVLMDRLPGSTRPLAVALHKRVIEKKKKDVINYLIDTMGVSISMEYLDKCLTIEVVELELL